MTLSDYIGAYLACGFVLLAWIAYLDRHDARPAFWAALLWPLVLVAIPVVMALEACPWRFLVVKRNDYRSPWGFRRPDDGWPGWALRCPWWELQVWKDRP